MAVLFVLAATPIRVEAAGHAAPTEAARAKARVVAQHGMRLYELGKYQEAAAEFDTAYQLTAAPDLLFNLAQSLRFAGNIERAVGVYHAYLRYPQSAPNRLQVKKIIAELEKKLKEPEAKSAPEPSSPLHASGPEPPAPAPYNQVVPQPPPPQSPAESPAPAERRVDRPAPGFGLKVAGGVLLGVGAAGVGGGIGLLVLAHSAEQAINENIANHLPFTSEELALWNRGRLYNTIGIAASIAGGVVAAGGVVLLAIGLKQGSAARTRVALATVRP